MRNSTFLGVVAVFVAGGLVVGWYGERIVDRLGIPASLHAKAAPAKEPRWRFTIDTTRNARSSEDDLPPAIRNFRPRNPGVCSMPDPNFNAQVVMFGVYESQALSSVAVGGTDLETGFIDVIIEPGDQPLYLILSSYDAMVWRLSGATNRVSKVVLTSTQRLANGTPAAAVIGLDEELIGVARGKGCPSSFYAPGAIDTVRAIQAVQRFTGRRPDVIAGHYDITAVRLPSGLGAVTRRSPKAPHGFDQQTWHEATRFSPAGLVTVDPALVKGPTPAMTYDVLPEQMGLAQLVGSGHIQRRGDVFRIVRSIPHFPAGLAGAHSVDFQIAEGISHPQGSAGHSCINGVGATC